MHVILPITNLAVDLQASTNFFCLRHNLSTLELGPSVELVKAMVDDDINGRLLWTSPSRCLDQAMERVLPWWGGPYALQGEDSISEVCQSYYCNVIDPTIIRVGGLLSQLMGGSNSEDMWHVWYTLPIGNDLLIERGEDYRVVEFERQVLSGNLSVNSKVLELIKRKHYGGFR